MPLGDRISIVNDSTELRIKKIKEKDLGRYICVASNTEGRIEHTTLVAKKGKH